MDDSALGIAGQKRASGIETLRKTRRLYEVTGGNDFRVIDLRPEQIGYRPDQKTQFYTFCDRLAIKRPDLISKEHRPSGIYFVWLGIPPQVESTSATDANDQFKVMRAEIDALTGSVSSLNSRVQDLEAWENSCLQNAASQVAATLAGLSPHQQEYVLRLAADLAAGKKSDK